MQGAIGIFARVKVEGESDLVIVPVSCRKPEIPAGTQEKWQGIIDLVARMLHVPSGLITRFTEENLEVFVASETAGNPYKRDDRDRLGIGMFCETVAGRRGELRVDDVSTSEYWTSNPHAGLGMKAYLGVPIEWEDGELFGTFCLLDDRANRFQRDYIDLMRQFKDIIEADLRYVALRAELEALVDAKELELREIRHRLKNQYNLLISFIDLQSRSGAGPDERSALKEIEHRIMALSLINEELGGAGGGDSISFDRYLRRLCEYMLGNFAARDLEIEYSIEGISLESKKAIPLALIVAELLTNTIKYAYPEPTRARRRVAIAVERREGGSLALVYRDDGVGFPEGFDPATRGGFGMLILRALARQLGGSLETANDGGARVAVRFPA